MHNVQSKKVCRKKSAEAIVVEIIHEGLNNL